MAKSPFSSQMDSLEDRYWSRVDKRGPDECWPWTGKAAHADGYGHLRVNGKRAPATHVALLFEGRPRPGKALALHTCDNPPCCNPAHLWWGTAADNMADMAAKGRSANIRGAASKLAKLTEEQVRAIRADSRTHRAIGADYGVDGSTVHCIKHRISWAHLD